LLEFVIQNYSREFSANRIKNFLKNKISFTDRTLYEYLIKLEDMLNLFFVNRFSQKIYERMSWPKKIYVADVGISNILSFSEDLGKRMENVVFLELLRYTNLDPLLEIYYYRDYQQREVDFVLKSSKGIWKLIQVTYASAKDEIDKREMTSLIKASNLLKCKNLTVITWNYEEQIKVEDKIIKCVPLWNMLTTINFLQSQI